MDDTGRSCREFTQILASAEPAPGGGGAAALMGAIGAALGAMVANLTVGKKKYADVEQEMIALEAACQQVRCALLDCVEKDAAGFLPLARAYGIPREDPGREQALQEATMTALSAPMEIMNLCCRAIEAAEVLAEKGSRLAVSDAGCAAVCCRAALESASLNVFINTASLKDRNVAARIDGQAEQMLSVYCPRADAVYRKVRGSFV